MQVQTIEILPAISSLLLLDFFHFARIQVLINAKQTVRSMCLHRCTLLTHVLWGETNSRPWENKRDLFHEHALAIAWSIGNRLQPRRLNAVLCLPERRELWLSSVNMSAQIFHSWRRRWWRRRIPLLHHFRAIFMRITLHSDTFTPVTSHNSVRRFCAFRFRRTRL